MQLVIRTTYSHLFAFNIFILNRMYASKCTYSPSVDPT